MADKPLTLILDKPKGVAKTIIAEDNSLAMRLANHDFCRAICRKLGRPIISTSANISGTDSPSTFEQISKEIKEGVDIVVDKCYEGKQTRKPSSIIKLTNDQKVTIIRE